MNDVAMRGVDGRTLHQVNQALESSERRELNGFLQKRVSPTLYEYIKQRDLQPTTVDDCIDIIQMWIESKSRDVGQTKCMSPMFQPACDSRPTDQPGSDSCPTANFSLGPEIATHR